jgi:hypothetical protein
VLLVLLALTSARVTRLLVADQFPPVARARSRLAAAGDWQAYLLSCPWCMGVWVAGVVTAVAEARYGLPAPLLVFPSVAWVSGWLGSVEQHDDPVDGG